MGKNPGKVLSGIQIFRERGGLKIKTFALKKCNASIWTGDGSKPHRSPRQKQVEEARKSRQSFWKIYERKPMASKTSESRKQQC